MRFPKLYNGLIMYRLYDKSRGSRSRWVGYRVPFALGLVTLFGAAAVTISSSQPDGKPGLTASTTQNNDQASVAPMSTRAEEATTVGLCTKTTVPFKTVYNDSDQMYVGESKEVGGTDGSTLTCKPDSSGNKPADVNVAPVDKVVTLGTLPRSAATPAKKNLPTTTTTCKQTFFQRIFNSRC
jgi:hypothetical protein